MIGRVKEGLKARNIEYGENVSLKRYSTIGISSTAEIMIFPGNVNELILSCDLLKASGYPFKVVGRMSNIMPSSEFYAGALINTGKIKGKYRADDYIVTECGSSLTSLVRFGAEEGLGGCEQLFHIPGTVGGAVFGNAGAHGLEISDVFVSGRFFDPISLNVLELSRDAMEFSYRHSALKSNKYILLEATISFSKKSRDEVYDDVHRYGQMRKSQPTSARSLGSTFKRVGNVSAGYYIDRAGLKGFRIGDAAVSDIHAGFVINLGNATPANVIDLINEIKLRVFDAFGVMLEEEIEIF